MKDRCSVCDGIHPGYVCQDPGFEPDEEWKRIRRESIPKMFERQKLRREGRLNKWIPFADGVNDVIEQLRRLGRL